MLKGYFGCSTAPWDGAFRSWRPFSSGKPSRVQTFREVFVNNMLDFDVVEIWVVRNYGLVVVAYSGSGCGWFFFLIRLSWLIDFEVKLVCGFYWLCWIGSGFVDTRSSWWKVIVIFLTKYIFWVNQFPMPKLKFSEFISVS